MAYQERQKGLVDVRRKHEDERRAKGINGLMINVIESRFVGPIAVEAAGELITEYARFNQWVLERKPRSTTADLWNLAAMADKCHSECLAAWQEYLASPQRGDRVGEFLEVLIAVTKQFRSVRENDVVEYCDPEMPEELREWP